MAATATADTAPPARAGASKPDNRALAQLAAACLALAIVSLIAPSSPTYDPWAWIVWGREVAHLDLNTMEGPSWKPLPVLFTTLFSLAGDDAAPKLWLVVGRFGALLAIALTYRLATRIGGRPAGAIAALGLLTEHEYVFNGGRGNSEGLLVALVLLAVERHLDGDRRGALWLGFAAGLLRPEVWPFLGLYGLWLWRADPARRKELVALAIATAVLWFPPEWWGSGDPFRASTRARRPLPDSPAFADVPALEVLRRAATVLPAPFLVLAAAGLAFAKQRRQVLTFAAMAIALLATVALMTQAGYAGNLRYVALPAAFVCIIAGAGAVATVQMVRKRTAWIAALVMLATIGVAPLAADDVRALKDDMVDLEREADLNEDMQRAIALAGGRERIVRCGPIYTSPFEVQTLAWSLHVHGEQIDLEPQADGTVLKPRFNKFPIFDRATYPRPRATRRFLVFQRCRT